MDIHDILEEERVHLNSGRSTWGLMCYEGVHGDDRRMLRISPLLETWASPCKKQKQMGFKTDRLLYRPSRLPVFVLEGLVLEAARDTLQLIAHSKEKRDASSLWYSSVTFFNLASTKLEDAVLDADAHTGCVAWQSEVSNNRPAI